MKRTILLTSISVLLLIPTLLTMGGAVLNVYVTLSLMASGFSLAFLTMTLKRMSLSEWIFDELTVSAEIMQDTAVEYLHRNTRVKIIFFELVLVFAPMFLALYLPSLSDAFWAIFLLYMVFFTMHRNLRVDFINVVLKKKREAEGLLGGGPVPTPN